MESSSPAPRQGVRSAPSEGMSRSTSGTKSKRKKISSTTPGSRCPENTPQKQKKTTKNVCNKRYYLWSCAASLSTAGLSELSSQLSVPENILYISFQKCSVCRLKASESAAVIKAFPLKKKQNIASSHVYSGFTVAVCPHTHGGKWKSLPPSWQPLKSHIVPVIFLSGLCFVVFVPNWVSFSSERFNEGIERGFYCVNSQYLTSSTSLWLMFAKSRLACFLRENN